MRPKEEKNQANIQMSNSSIFKLGEMTVEVKYAQQNKGIEECLLQVLQRKMK